MRNYWWLSTFGGVYFAGDFWLWGGTRAAVFSSVLFLCGAVVGLVLHYCISWNRRWPQVLMIEVHLFFAQAILVWQKSHLPLSDYSHLGNPASRGLLIYLVSTLIMGAMSMFGGIWGAVVGLSTHYAFIFDLHEEFSFKWFFPIFMVLAGAIVSNAFWRLDQAYEQLELLANRDHLTGLLNRNRLDIEFERLQTLSQKTGQTLLLVAWDLDGLKQINDQQGHAVGDTYIRNFANTLLENVRKPSDARFGDAAFRVGGDEFISMHLAAYDGVTLVQRVHESCPFVSAGWVRCNSLTLDQALTHADHALYDTKERRKQGASIPAGLD